MKIKNGVAFPDAAAKHIGVTSEIQHQSHVACKGDLQAIAKLIKEDKHDRSWG